MRVTTQHPASSYGQPVILADDGDVMDYGPGVKAIRGCRGWSTQQLADKIGVSPRTVEGWEQGRPISNPALNLIAILLKK